MKLNRLHIENFGGLSQYDLAFGDGLTVLCQPNGFGKTTLAEFIRAMFYGFPRKAKTLDKSLRQKYTPWNGGKYGGNLTFSLDGHPYRVERTFGATPKGDTFTLIDLATGKKSDRFSDQIGLELFKLDADSYERSTYMPQLRDQDKLTTDAIQAKLGNLVEDPGDMGSFDKAVSALKTQRSGYIPYRGSGGAVAEAKNQVFRLREEAQALEGKRTRLHDIRQELENMELQLDEAGKLRQQIRDRLLQASEADALAGIHREYRRLEEETRRITAELENLEAKYPAGLPTRENVGRIRELAGSLPEWNAKAAATESELEAKEFLEKNREFFREKVPNPEELETCRRQIGQLQILKTEMENTGLSQQEKREYEALLVLAEAGKLEETRLKDLEEKHSRWIRLTHEHAAAGLNEEDGARLAQLRGFFGPGIPEMKEIDRCREALAEEEKLHLENRQRMDLLGCMPQKQKGVAGLVALCVLAALGLGAGAGLLAYGLTVYGWACLAVGAVLLAGAVAAALTMGNRRKAEANRHRTIRGEMEQCEERIRGLERQTAEFTGRYCPGADRDEALYEIRDNLEELDKLAVREKTAAAKQAALREQTEDLRAELAGALGEGDFGQLLVDLRVTESKFAHLRKELQLARETQAALAQKGEELTGQIRELLDVYYPGLAPEDFQIALSQLHERCTRWNHAREQVAAWETRRQRQKENIDLAEGTIDGFFREFGLARQEVLSDQLLAIQEDLRAAEELHRRLSSAEADREVFCQSHAEELAREIPEQREDLAQLRSREQELTIRENELTGQYLARKQLHNQLRQEMDNLPRIRDELEIWQEKWERGKENARLLDDTMTFLETARENLQNSYLGPVRDSFAGYMKELMGEDANRILLTADLDVQLERAGQARELGYFSAGQTDTVLLCMRLALVDALFTDIQPIMILDDPFINLDDERTAQALKLLETIGTHRQILYLSCNSSRI